jgi:hypothetical protein
MARVSNTSAMGGGLVKNICAMARWSVSRELNDWYVSSIIITADFSENGAGRLRR